MLIVYAGAVVAAINLFNTFSNPAYAGRRFAGVYNAFLDTVLCGVLGVCTVLIVTVTVAAVPLVLARLLHSLLCTALSWRPFSSAVADADYRLDELSEPRPLSRSRTRSETIASPTNQSTGD